jgi:hypothetical protein
MRILKKANLFISYSREDQSLADSIYKALVELGYGVFFDREGILVGEDFNEKIKQSLKRTDAMVFIISKDSVQSKWCKAEVYSSIALNKKLIPIRYNISGSDYYGDFVLISRQTNYIDIKREEDIAGAVKKIHKMLYTVRRQKLLKRLGLLMAAMAVIFLSILFFRLLVDKVNDWNLNKKKVDLIAKVKTSGKIYNEKQLEILASDFVDDNFLKTEMWMISHDKAHTANARMNALLIDNHLNRHNKPHERLFLHGVNLTDNTFNFGLLNNATFTDSCQINNITALGSIFSNLLWGAAVSSAKFKSCYFFANRMLPKSMVAVDFENCVFRGGELDLSEMGAVHFYLEKGDTSSTVITNELALFENVVMKNCVEPPPPGVIEILSDDSEVRFTSVLFESCHFRGFIRPKWFEHCIFSNCVFPAGIELDELEKQSCILQQVLTSNEPCF